MAFLTGFQLWRGVDSKTWTGWDGWFHAYYVFQAPASLALASEGHLLPAEGVVWLLMGVGFTGSGVGREADGGGVSGTGGWVLMALGANKAGAILALPLRH